MKERVLGRRGWVPSLIVAVIGAAFFNLIECSALCRRPSR
jgi:hypothetical protein